MAEDRNGEKVNDKDGDGGGGGKGGEAGVG